MAYEVSREHLRTLRNAAVVINNRLSDEGSAAMLTPQDIIGFADRLVAIGAAILSTEMQMEQVKAPPEAKADAKK